MEWKIFTNLQQTNLVLDLKPKTNLLSFEIIFYNEFPAFHKKKPFYYGTIFFRIGFNFDFILWISGLRLSQIYYVQNTIQVKLFLFYFINTGKSRFYDIVGQHQMQRKIEI